MRDKVNRNVTKLMGCERYLCSIEKTARFEDPLQNLLRMFNL